MIGYGARQPTASVNATFISVFLLILQYKERLKTTLTKLEWVRDHIVDVVLMSAAVGLIAIYLALDLLDIQQFVIVDAIMLFLLAEVSLYSISMGYKNESSFEKINSSLQKNSVDNETLNESVKAINSEIKDIKKESTATVRELNSQAEFYRVLNDKVMSATNNVWLMHLDPHAPDSDIYSDPVRKDYFDNCLKKAKTQSIEIRRIISIPTPGKLEWTQNLVRDTKDLRNFLLAYIDIPDIENSFPISVTSCQIIDNRVMFLLNPSLNVVPEGEFRKCIIIENENVVSIYKRYYESIWDSLKERNGKLGCIIKDGPGTAHFDRNLQRIKDDIARKSLQHGEGADPAALPEASEMDRYAALVDGDDGDFGA